MVVAQDVFLFTTTLENNIAYGEPLARLDEIEGAADDAQIHDHIAGLDARYQTLVGVRRLMIWNSRGDFGAEVIGSSGSGYAALR